MSRDSRWTKPRPRLGGRGRKQTIRSLASILRVVFFQAEDGIRDVAVTGVQTCALPICKTTKIAAAGILVVLLVFSRQAHAATSPTSPPAPSAPAPSAPAPSAPAPSAPAP